MNTTQTLPAELPTETSAPSALKPANWKTSLLLFYIPAAVVVLSYYVLLPWFESLGLSQITSYMTALCIPMALMFASALVAYHKVEGNPLTWKAFSERMRFPKLRWQDPLIGLGIFLVAGTGYFLLSQVETSLVRSGILPVPANLPIFDNPTADITNAVLNQAAGGQIHGQWPILVLYLVVYFFNIAGEEFWWRGYIFPRQELVFGKYTWLVHGVMWATFHAFKYWDIIALLPVTLAIAFAAQKLKNNWPGLFAHAFMNIMGPIGLFIAVIG